MQNEARNFKAQVEACDETISNLCAEVDRRIQLDQKFSADLAELGEHEYPPLILPDHPPRIPCPTSFKE